MKTCARKLPAMLALLSTVNCLLSTVVAQGTAFTYQGQLQNNGALANGSFDLTFTLFNTNTSGAAVAGPVTNSGVVISNGLFTVTIDFGAGVWNGQTNWLEIAVETNGSGPFTTLSPRQRITPTPYAITAENIDGTIGSNALSGSYGNAVILNNSANQFTGAFTGNGGGLTNVNAATLAGLGTSSFWQTTGNAGTAPSGNFVGTTDSQPLNLRASGRRALHLEYAVVDVNHSGVNVIGGDALNFVAPGVIGATIAGGGTSNFFQSALSNQVLTSFGTVGGGFLNTAGQFCDTVAGGRFNNSSGSDSCVGGGIGNTNTGFAAGIPGGYHNLATGQYSFAAGQQAQALHTGSFVWSDAQITPFASTQDDQFDVRAGNGAFFNTSGAGLWVDGQLVAVSSGQNTFSAAQTFTGGLDVNSTNGFSQSSVGNFAIDAPFKPGGRFVILTNGNVGISNSAPGHLFVVGNAVSPAYCDGGAWVNGSDRNSKEDFAAINPRKLLDKVVALPISRWKYKVEPEGMEHLGPMAQDFHSAFGLNGADDTHISTVDEGGVALAAIQGLNEKLEAENSNLKERNDSLEKRLEALEQIVLKQSQQTRIEGSNP
jgi:hypothetical protein